MAASTINLFVLAVFTCATLGNARLFRSHFFNKWFEGDGTYYGGGATKWQAGNCALRSPRPRWFSNYVPVAMNNKQYSGMCGACLDVIGTGKGLGANPIKGRFKAMVMDRCPECKYGDLDLARNGDGRWHLRWRIIPCAKQGPIEFQFEGSNLFYHKVQPRNLRSPVTKVVIGGVVAQAKQDNHWVAQNGAGFRKPTKIEVWTVLGAHLVAYVNSHSSGVVRPFRVNGGRKRQPLKKKDDDDDKKPHRKPNRRPARRPVRKPVRKPTRKPSYGQCVPVWQHCRGPKNRWGTGRCCGGRLCVYRHWHGHKCLPTHIWHRRCVPKWRDCRGKRNTWGTSRCCNGFKCMHRGGRFRCVEPPKCVGRWQFCGHGWPWRTWRGKRMSGRNCCARGTRCQRKRYSISFICRP